MAYLNVGGGFVELAARPCSIGNARNPFESSTIRSNQENNYAPILSNIRKPHLYATQLNLFRIEPVQKTTKTRDY